jgi:hypothetical protein
MRPPSLVAVQLKRRPFLIKTPFRCNGPARPAEITGRRLFVHQCRCMAALANRAGGAGTCSISEASG